MNRDEAELFSLIWSIVKLLVSFQNVVSLGDLLSENDFYRKLQGFI